MVWKKKKKEDWILKKGRIKSVSNKCKKKSATQLENGKKTKAGTNKQKKPHKNKQQQKQQGSGRQFLAAHLELWVNHTLNTSQQCSDVVEKASFTVGCINKTRHMK